MSLVEPPPEDGRAIMTKVASRRTVLARLATAVAALFAVPRSAAVEPQRWICTFNECEHWVWDPLHGDPPDVAGRDPVPPGIAFENLPEDWRCPVCGAPKVYFTPTDKPWKPMA
jgi:rubredoxin